MLVISLKNLTMHIIFRNRQELYRKDFPFGSWKNKKYDRIALGIGDFRFSGDEPSCHKCVELLTGSQTGTWIPSTIRVKSRFVIGASFSYKLGGHRVREQGEGQRKESIRVTPLIQRGSGVVLGRNLNKRDLAVSLLDNTEANRGRILRNLGILHV